MRVSVRETSEDTRAAFSRASPGAGEHAFAFAKASGIIGKSFVGKRISALGRVASLADLDRLVFPDAGREALSSASQNLPGRELLVDLERRILRRTTRHMIAVMHSYERPPELLVRMLRSCEYTDLKACLRHIIVGKEEPPAFIDIGRFRTVQFESYPDLALMLKGSEFEFVLKKDLDSLRSPDFDINSLEAELDRHYYALLIKSLHQLGPEDRHFVETILAQEISLRNCVWALRLRVYFKKKPGETAEYLMGITSPQDKSGTDSQYGVEEISGKRASFAADARESLHFSLNYRPDWKKWRWESLLNPELATENWEANPRYFQNAASRYIYRLAQRYFHREPFSVGSIFCFFKIKQFEEDILTSLAEGLALGMGGGEVFDVLEMPR